MAGTYNKESAIAAQNAGSTAATIYASLVNSGKISGWDENEYNVIRTAVFNGTLALAGAGAVVEYTEGTNQSNASPGPSQRSGGGSDSGAGVVLNFGRFRGRTIQDVADEDASYVNWLAASSNNPFIKEKAQEFLNANPQYVESP